MSVTIPMAHVPTSSRMVFAHRGLNHQAPENTMPAFEAAAGAGVTWIETDVDIIADGTPILIHDSTLDRTTNRTSTTRTGSSGSAASPICKRALRR